MPLDKPKSHFAPIKLPYAENALEPVISAKTISFHYGKKHKAYADKLKASGVPTVYRQAEGNIHGYICLRQGIPSSQTDIEGNLAALKEMLAEIMAPA